METLHQKGEVIGERYLILDILGQGGVGITYEAKALNSEEKVALKALSLRGSNDWKAMELFEREAKVLSQLNHPNIPRYLDYFSVDTEGDRYFYIVLELALGQSLGSLVKQGWHSSEKQVREIALELLTILTYLHSLSPPVIHRDLKPENIIRREDGKIFLVDFGAVQNVYYSTLMRGSTVAGTYGYMAPEQFQGRALPASDLYSLGATLLFLLTHRSPAELPTKRLKIDFRSRVPLEEPFADFLEKILDPDLEKRFSTAVEAKKALLSKPGSRFGVSSQATVRATLALIATFALFSTSNQTLPMIKNFFISQGFRPTGVCQNRNTLRAYLQQGGTPNARTWYAKDSEDQRTLLNCALMLDAAEEAYLLIAKGANVHEKNEYGQTPLLYAADHSNLELTKLLIAKGANVNEKDEYDRTPLMLAVSRRDLELVKLLIAKGANVNEKDEYGRTVLFKVIYDNNYGRYSQRQFEKYYPRQSVFFKDIYENDLELAELLIANGANVNEKDKYGQTPLTRALEIDNVEMQKLLSSYGAK